ncbi:NUDIX hydrolase [Ornithinibacillus contaminans]|uniref:NUDIX hydrolase n=1 Tax=Ornithinibacillus contaminans TaxID=694055 RepID=UPI00064D842F|nr:NUDIX domain-containing protein [Ornithinibacillus contaminans]
MTSIHVNWGKSNVKLTWKQDYVAPRELVTSVHGFCFSDEKLLLVDLNQRGWDIPGGHIEPHETPEECFHREVIEEGYVEGINSLLGSVEIDHHENPAWDDNSPYPIIGYQMFYRMDITTFHDFEGRHEASRRKLINPIDIGKYYQGVSVIHREILAYAVQMGSKILLNERKG